MWSTSGEQRTIRRSPSSPSTREVLGVRLESSDLAQFPLLMHCQSICIDLMSSVCPHGRAVHPSVCLHGLAVCQSIHRLALHQSVCMSLIPILSTWTCCPSVCPHGLADPLLVWTGALSPLHLDSTQQLSSDIAAASPAPSWTVIPPYRLLRPQRCLCFGFLGLFGNLSSSLES